jgi:hypothetical protein
MGLFLRQLQEQLGNAALVAARTQCMMQGIGGRSNALTKQPHPIQPPLPTIS